MSSPRSPQFALILLLVVAACIVAGGAFLARRTETVRVPRDRTPVREFAGAVEEQMQRLEQLYASHLKQIASGVVVKNPAASRLAAQRIVGVQRLSILFAEGAREPDVHLPAMKPPPGVTWPEPTLREKLVGIPRPVDRLPQAEILDHEAERSGWIDRPGKPLYYWQRRDEQNAAVVVSVDREEVAAAFDAWFRAWMDSGASGAITGLGAEGGPDRLLGGQGAALGSVGPEPALPDRPDFLLPLRARFGTWQLASWDRHETRTNYHVPTLVGAALLGLFTALLGFVVFNQQRRALALAAQRVSFVNRVSHELRTPLTNILLNLDLATEAAEESPTEAGRRLGLVREEAHRLGRLIENVLSFSRSEQGRLQIDPRACVPASVVDAVVEQFAPSFTRRALVVRRAGEVRAACQLDSDALAQILSNLLSNAEKYVPGGTVEIASSLTDGALTITVSDEGAGIPARDAERIFEPFERLSQRVTEGASGTGLGLAIARELAMRMGGSLRLAPSARGASFELRVPAPAASGPAIVSAA